MENCTYYLNQFEFIRSSRLSTRLFFPVQCFFAAKPQKGIVRVNDRGGG